MKEQEYFPLYMMTHFVICTVT